MVVDRRGLLWTVVHPCGLKRTVALLFQTRVNRGHCVCPRRADDRDLPPPAESPGSTTLGDSDTPSPRARFTVGRRGLKQSAKIPQNAAKKASVRHDLVDERI